VFAEVETETARATCSGFAKSVMVTAAGGASFTILPRNIRRVRRFAAREECVGGFGDLERVPAARELARCCIIG